MRFAGSAPQAQFEYMLPFAYGVGINRLCRSVERKEAASVLSRESHALKPVVSQFATLPHHPCDKLAQCALLLIPMRFAYLDTAFLTEIHVSCTLFGDIIRRNAVQFARGGYLSRYANSVTNYLKRIMEVQFKSLFYIGRQIYLKWRNFLLDFRIIKQKMPVYRNEKTNFFT